MQKVEKKNSVLKKSYIWLTLLRILIGWHFMYEGLVKIANPNWSSVSYLLDSKGLFAGIFHRIAASPGLLQSVDFINAWGLFAIGLALILGLLTRFSLIAGIALLFLYYLSHPPFVGLDYALPMEGNYLVVNKVLIELVAMIVLLFFPTGRYIGLDRFIFRKTDQGNGRAL